MSWDKAPALPNSVRGDKAWEVVDFLRVFQNVQSRREPRVPNIVAPNYSAPCRIRHGFGTRLKLVAPATGSISAES
jgi:hypothetical protein